MKVRKTVKPEIPYIHKGFSVSESIRHYAKGAVKEKGSNTSEQSALVHNGPNSGRQNVIASVKESSAK